MSHELQIIEAINIARRIDLDDPADELVNIDAIYKIIIKVPSVKQVPMILSEIEKLSSFINDRSVAQRSLNRMIELMYRMLGRNIFGQLPGQLEINFNKKEE